MEYKSRNKYTYFVIYYSSQRHNIKTFVYRFPNSLADLFTKLLHTFTSEVEVLLY